MTLIVKEYFFINNTFKHMQVGPENSNYVSFIKATLAWSTLMLYLERILPII